MTRYELATLTITLGSAPKVAEGVGAYARDGGGRLLGVWASDIGGLNEVAVLRGFDDDAALAKERDRGLRSANPFNCAEHLTRLSMDSYAPFPGVPPVETGSFGPVYEIRTYLLKVGGLTPTLEGWAERLPGRIAVSPLVVAMYTLDGPSRITHIWPYASTNDRFQTRTDTVRQGIWPPRSAAWLAEMRSGIYLPTAVSPLT